MRSESLITTADSPSSHQSLWLHFRSTDYGTTYEKLNEKVGVKTILSYLYVSPNNKRKVRFMASVSSFCYTNALLLFMMSLLRRCENIFQGDYAYVRAELKPPCPRLWPLTMLEGFLRSSSWLSVLLANLSSGSIY